MKTCPRCHKIYAEISEDGNFCPDDGSELVSYSDPYLGLTLLGQFEIKEICGRGSAGSVYRALQVNMDREVAVKILHSSILREPRLVKRFEREARAAAKLAHPHIIGVHFIGKTEDGAPFLVMEYVQGPSLDAVCRHEGLLDLDRAINIARQICAALTEAHSQKIVHRDLKPENILLTSQKQNTDFVKVVDFGIAKILQSTEDSSLSQTGAIIGTPHYISPEQAAGNEIDHRADLYALGVILFRMCVGRLPFNKQTSMAVLMQHLNEKPPKPRDINSDIPLALEKLILKAMDKSPDKRFQSAQEFDEALAQIQTQVEKNQPRSNSSKREKTDPKKLIEQNTAAGTSPSTRITVDVQAEAEENLAPVDAALTNNGWSAPSTLKQRDGNPLRIVAVIFVVVAIAGLSIFIKRGSFTSSSQTNVPASTAATTPAPSAKDVRVSQEATTSEQDNEGASISDLEKDQAPEKKPEKIPAKSQPKIKSSTVKKVTAVDSSNNKSRPTRAGRVAPMPEDKTSRTAGGIAEAGAVPPLPLPIP